MIPGSVDLEFVRGDDFSHKFAFVDDTTSAPLNLTGMTFAAKVRLFEDDVPFVAFTVDQTNLATGILIISLAKARGVFTPCLDSIVEHLHPGFDGREDLRQADPTYMAAVEHSAEDEQTFKNRLPLIEMQRTSRAK